MGVPHSTRTTNHVPHAYTYADATAREAATGFVSGDVGKLASQTDGRRKLWRLAATTPTWDVLVPTGKNVIYVDPEGEGDFTLLSDAIAACDSPTSNNQYLIVVVGQVAETAKISAADYVHVQGMAGAKLTVTFAAGSNNDAVEFSSNTNTTWRDLKIVVAGTGARYGVNVTGCDSTVVLDRIETSKIAVPTGTVTLYKPVAQVIMDGTDSIGGNEILDATGVFGISRQHECAAFHYMLYAQTDSATPVEMLDKNDNRLVLPNLASWTFEIVVTGNKGPSTAQAGSYIVTGGIRRTTSAANTFLVSTPIYSVWEDDTAWDVTVSADTSNGALKVEVTGNTGDLVNWSAYVRIVQALQLAE